MCFNLTMDPTFQAYKEKIEMRIAGILSESLSKGIITADQSDEMATYILDNIDLTTTSSDLLTFVENLSAKWPIFNSILAASDQSEESPAAANQVQEKTDQVIQATEDLIKENKLDEALQVAKTATENSSPDLQDKIGGII
jgi:hypothetical protein